MSFVDSIETLSSSIEGLKENIEYKRKARTLKKLDGGALATLYEEECILCEKLESLCEESKAKVREHSALLKETAEALSKVGDYLNPLLCMSELKRKSSIKRLSLSITNEEEKRSTDKPDPRLLFSSRKRSSAQLVSNKKNTHYFVSPVVIGFMSRFPFLSVFRDFLCEIFLNYIKCVNTFGKNFEIPPHLDINLFPEAVELKASPKSIFATVDQLRSKTPVPPHGRIEIRLLFENSGHEMFYGRPPVNFFPFEINNFSLRMMCELLSAQNVLLLFGGLLLEHKVVLISNNPSALHVVSESLLSLLYPLKWHYTYIPVLPSYAIDVLESPSPFFVGCHPSCIYGDNDDSSLECFPDVIYVDLDTNKAFLSPECEYPKLPPNIEKFLLNTLQVVCTKQLRVRGVHDFNNSESQTFVNSQYDLSEMFSSNMTISDLKSFPKSYNTCFSFPFIDSSVPLREGKEMVSRKGCYFSRTSCTSYRDGGYDLGTSIQSSLSVELDASKVKREKSLNRNEPYYVASRDNSSRFSNDSGSGNFEIQVQSESSDDFCDRSEGSFGSHKFSLKHFSKGTICSVCSEQISGITSNGYICAVCGSICHKKCIEGAKSSLCGTFNETSIRWEFLKGFSVLMKNYRDFFKKSENVLVKSSSDPYASYVQAKIDVDSIEDVFLVEDYISEADKEMRPFLTRFSKAYGFLDFMVYRLNTPETNYDILFFDEYMKWRKKKATVFLQNDCYGFTSTYNVNISEGIVLTGVL